MPRTSYGVARHRKHKKVLKQARGMRGGRSKLYRTAKHAVLKAQTHATAARRKRKGDFRRLWITRISGALLEIEGINYSRFINGLKKAQIELDRKTLSELAIHDPAAFGEIVEKAKAALSA